MIKRITFFAYGLTSYAVSLCVFLYLFGFLGNIGVPKSLDSSLEVSIFEALLANTLLLALFAVQHSLMARPFFKKWWTKFVPKPIERSTYLLFSCLALFLLFWKWQPMGGIVWKLEDPTYRVLCMSIYASGWLVVLASTFLLNHFDLFGLRQVYLYLLNRPYTQLPFRTPAFYKMIRHPLYLGWLVTFWVTPTMTAAHLVFAIATTSYIFMAIRWEERDLETVHGQAYVEYRRSVPMIIPSLSVSKLPEPEVHQMPKSYGVSE